MPPKILLLLLLIKYLYSLCPKPITHRLYIALAQEFLTQYHCCHVPLRNPLANKNPNRIRELKGFRISLPLHSFSPSCSQLNLQQAERLIPLLTLPDAVHAVSCTASQQLSISSSAQLLHEALLTSLPVLLQYTS